MKANRSDKVDTTQEDALHADVKAGFDELDRGEGIEVDDAGLREFFDHVQARGQHRYDIAKNRA